MLFGGEGGTAATSGELDVQAMAEPSTNSVLVLGPADDIEQVELLVIEPFENELGERFVPETVTVSNAKPSQVASFVRQMLNAGGMDGADGATAPQLIPVDGNNTIVVSGPPAQRARVRQLIEQFDDPSLVSSQVLVRKIPRTLDALELAPTIERSVNESEQLLARQQNREPNLVVISAQDQTNTLVITGEQSAFGMANQIIDQIIEAGGATGVVTRVIELDRITSQDAIRLIQELQQNRSGGNRSGTRRTQPQPGTRRGGRGSWLWNSPQQPYRQRVEETPVASRSPQLTRAGSRVVSTVLLTPLILLAAPDAASAQTTSNAVAADEAARSVTVDAGYGRDVATENEGGDVFADPSAAARAVTGSNSGRALRTGGGRLVLVSASAEERARALTAAEKLQALRERLEQQRQAVAGGQAAAPAVDAATSPAAAELAPAPTGEKSAAPTPVNAGDGVLLAANNQPTRPQNEQRAGSAATGANAANVNANATAADVVVSAETDAPPAGTEVAPGVLSGELLGDVEAAEIDGNRIILQGAESDIEFLIALLRSMEASAPISELRVITLENAKATALVDIVQQAVQSLVDARTGGQPGAADRFSITAEARSNSLIVAASEENLADIVRIVDQLDRSGDRDVQFELVPLQHVRAADAATQLRPVIERLNAVREIPAEVQPSIEANERANSILVIGTPSEIDEITRLVSAVDVPLEPEDRGSQFGTVSEMLIVNLKNNTAEAVAELLNSLIEAEQERARTALTGAAAAPVVRQLQLKTPGGAELPPLDLEKPIRLIPDDGTNSLLVYSTPENNTALVDIINTFDQQPIGADMDVKAFQLQHASAEQVAGIIEEVFQESEATLLRPAERGESFDQGVMPPVPPGLAARGLPYRVAISFDTRSNTVFVVGREAAVILAGGLIKEMDQSSSSLALKPRVIELKAVQASQMAETLEELLEERQEVLGGAQGAARDVAVIQPLERSNALIVIATDDVFEMIDDMIFQLDSADSYRVIVTEYVPLKAADALKIQTLLTEVFDAKEEAEGAVQEDAIDSLTITADPRTNALLLTGTRDYITEAMQLIAQFDREFGPTVAFEVFQVKLNSAENIASRLQDMIETAFADEESNLSGQPIHIDYDPVIDGVLVAAAPEDLQNVARWIEILDQPSRFDPMTAIVPLARADAEEVAETATEIFGEAGDGTFVVTIRPDTASNAVVVKAPPAVLNDIRNFVQKLDGVEPGSAAVVKIFKLDKADAEEAGELLNNILAGEGGAVGGDGGDAAREAALRKVMLIYQRDADMPPVRAFRDEIVVTAVVRTNSLVVQAPSSALPLVESLVTAIDVPPDAARIRIFTLRNSDAEQMVETLEQLFEERVEDSETGRELTLGSPLGIGGRQEVSFAADTRTNSVIAAGTPGYLDVVEEFVVELDSQPIEERKTIVYDPRYLPPQSIVDSFSQFSEAEQALLDELAEDVSAQRRLEREIIAILNEDEEAGNKVILSFDPRREPEVMEILRQLDQAPPQVNIEVLILEVNLNNSLELGIEFAAQDLQYTAAGVNDTTTFDYVYGTDIGAAGSGLGGFSFTITGRDFNFLLRTLQTESDVRVLSRPSITVMDNKEATFENIERFPFITSSTVTDGGNTITSVDREPVGITLTVTPQINPDGYVRLAVEQEISSITDSNVVIDNVVQPITFERTTNTTINVKDSETVVLGGLITDRQTRTENKIPLLGDIPIIGRLFRFENDETSRSELLVVLTPRIINTVDDYRGISIAQRDAGYMSPETKASPLMNDLRVPLPDEQVELPGKIETIEEPTRIPPKRPKPRRPADTYGPLNDLEAVRAELRPAPAATDERDAYRVPVGRRD